MGGAARHHHRDGREEDLYPAHYPPDPGVVPQLVFALNHDGLEPGVFRACDAADFERDLRAALDERPTGGHLRRLLNLYEFMTRRTLDRPDATTGPYVPLAEPERYFTASPVRSRRHRVDDNLLRVLGFSPIVRCTARLSAFDQQRFDQRARGGRLRHRLRRRRAAARHRVLYTKETRSSFFIEREEPSPKRVERFVQLLRLAPRLDQLDERALVELQQAIVDPRFADSGWRPGARPPGRPRAPCLAGAGVLDTTRRLDGSDVVAFGFVFLHSFTDGNGRVHRFPIHRELARRGYVPRDLIFPVSHGESTVRSDASTGIGTSSRRRSSRPCTRGSRDGGRGPARRARPAGSTSTE